MRTFGRGDTFLPPEIIACGRTPRGHPEGLREAFANLYAELAQDRIARELGEPATALPVSAHRRRRAHDGVHRGLCGVAGRGRLGAGRTVARVLMQGMEGGRRAATPHGAWEGLDFSWDPAERTIDALSPGFQSKRN